MRKLMWFTIGFASGIALCFWLLDKGWYYAVAALAVVSLTLFVLRSPKNTTKALAFVFTGCIFGVIWWQLYDAIWLQPARAYHCQTIDTTILINDYSSESSYGISADGTVVLDNRRYSIKVYLNDTEPLKPGDKLDGRFKLRYTGKTDTQTGSRYQAEGIYLLAYAEGDPYIFRTEQSSQRFFIANLRNKIYSIIDDLYPQDTKGFAKALLLGEASDLSETVDNAFRNSGIRHIIAVSGLHVSILFTSIYKAVGKRRWLSALIGLPVLFGFAALAGFTSSVVRACIMQGLMIFSLLLYNDYDPPTSLAFAVLMILGVNPLAIGSVSFQLSVLSVVGIFLFSGNIHRYLISRKWMGKVTGKNISSKLKRWFVSSISVSLSAISLTTPITAVYFGTVSCLGVLTNLLTLWCITYIFCGIGISCILGFVYLPAGALAAQVISILMRFVQLVARLIGSIPYATVSAHNNYIACWLLFTYLLIIAFILFGNRKPGLLCGCIILGLCISLLFNWLERKQCDYQITVLDVGQGQCILLQSDDSCYVVDCGSDVGSNAANLASSSLRSQGIFEIDGLILTHFDADHMGGAASLLSQIPIETVYIPDADANLTLRTELESAYSGKISVVQNNTYFSCGNAYISIFPAQPGVDGNNSSLSILFQAENCDILITGDLDESGEEYLLDSIRLPDIEILVAGHHGAKDSTSLALLDQLRPETVVISVGRDNPYGHPASETIDKLALFDCQIWRTDQNGTLIFRG